jgi:hypothetical protein
MADPKLTGKKVLMIIPHTQFRDEEFFDLYSTLGANATRRGVDVRAGTAEAFAVRRRGGAGSVDLGCSSEYSSETLEGRSGKWFRLNSIWRRVSRS